jgi:RNA polymerase sigma-70 factor (ECF subfamily)
MADRTVDDPIDIRPAAPKVRPAAVPAELIENARKGDERAFELLFAAYHGPLLRYLRTISPGIADEVSAATWESVARSLRTFRGDGNAFRGWLFTIARRRLADEVRRLTRRPVILMDSIDDRPADISDPAPIDWAAEVLRRIPARQADVVSLRVVGGLPVDEVASLLGITRENVRVLSHRGVNAIRAVLAQSPDLLTDDGAEEIRLIV